MNSSLKNQKINILIIDENVVPLTLVVIRCLGIQPEWNLHVLSLGNLVFPQFRFSMYVKTCQCVKFSDEDHAFDIIKDTAIKVNARIIIPVNEKIVKIISARYLECLEFASLPPIPELAVLNMVRNKWLLYNWLHKINANYSEPLLLSEVIKNQSLAKSLSFPILIKPHWGSGGKGIISISNLEDLGNFLSTDIRVPHEILIQPVIKGFDIDISALVQEGDIVAYSIQRSIEKNSKYVYSKEIEFVKNPLLLEQASDIFKKLNYSGIAHLDFRFDINDNTYKLIDFNARYWSTLMGSLNAGINFPQIAVNRVLGIIENQAEYKCQKYYVEVNPMKILLKGIPLKSTELYYSIRDPIPLIMEFIFKSLSYLKKSCKKIRFCRKSEIKG